MYFISYSELLAPNWLWYIWLHVPCGKDYLSCLWKSGRWSGLHTQSSLQSHNPIMHLKSSDCGLCFLHHLGVDQSPTSGSPPSAESEFSMLSYWSDNSSQLKHDLTYYLCFNLKLTASKLTYMELWIVVIHLKYMFLLYHVGTTSEWSVSILTPLEIHCRFASNYHA